MASELLEFEDEDEVNEVQVKVGSKRGLPITQTTKHSDKKDLLGVYQKKEFQGKPTFT